MARKSLVITKGAIFNSLTIIEELEKKINPSGQKSRMFLCKCKCGNDTSVRLSHLVSGKIKTCGCSHGEFHKKSNTKLYHVWSGIQERCHKNYTTEKNKKNYQEKGVIVCAEWRNSFTAFYEWSIANGYKEGLQLDRRDNNGNYEPSNCRYVTQTVNIGNRQITKFITIYGEKKTVAEWSRVSGFPYKTLYNRLNKPWNDNTILKPIKKIQPTLLF